MNVSQGLLPFQLIQDASKVLLTSFGGLPLVMETFRALGLPQSIQKHLALLQRQGKYQETDYVESFVSVFAGGGDCVDDFELLRSDEGLKKLGLRVPSPEAARFFLNAFHEEELLGDRLPHQAFIPEETMLLQGLRQVSRDLAWKAVSGDAPWKATIDLDASVIESQKREAYETYLGEKGYQPVIAYWAEEDLILADQFRDGNVPAGVGLLPVLKDAVSALPSSIRLIRVRSDTAAYVHEVLNWCRKEVPGRPRIEYAISADMRDELRAAIQALPEEAWKPLRKMTDQGLVVGRKEWAEVEFVPAKPSRKKNMKPDRYLAIRIRPAQGELFQDGNPYHYFAVVTNMWSWDGERLLQWQRERCGTVEKVHDVLKNDLAAGVLPAKRFFANAAWWRLNVMTYNVLSVMKRKSLPSCWWSVRLKALRYHLLCIAGRIIEHSRRLFLKIAKDHPSFQIYKEAREKLSLFSSA
ncbi:MAG TPA: IS1380 family transposase [Thermodesulfobacteriota bacterium]|nr:IS1380 family transposase [Thermodesulfobacteriota bacterium]